MVMMNAEHEHLVQINYHLGMDSGDKRDMLILEYSSQDTEDHECNFCGVQKFSLVGVDVKYLFYI